MTPAHDTIFAKTRAAGREHRRAKSRQHMTPAGREELLRWLETPRFSPEVHRAAKWMRAEPANPDASSEVLAELRHGFRKWRDGPEVMGFTTVALETHKNAIAAVRQVRRHQRHEARQRGAEAGYAGLMATINQAAE